MHQKLLTDRSEFFRKAFNPLTGMKEARTGTMSLPDDSVEVIDAYLTLLIGTVSGPFVTAKPIEMPPDMLLELWQFLGRIQDERMADQVMNFIRNEPRLPTLDRVEAHYHQFTSEDKMSRALMSNLANSMMFAAAQLPTSVNRGTTSVKYWEGVELSAGFLADLQDEIQLAALAIWVKDKTSRGVWNAAHGIKRARPRQLCEFHLHSPAVRCENAGALESSHYNPMPAGWTWTGKIHKEENTEVPKADKTRARKKK